MSGAARIGALGAALCLLAGAFAVPALYVPGSGLVVLALASVSAVQLATRGARVELEVDETPVQEGEPVLARISVHGGLARLCGGELRPAPATPWRALARGARAARLELRPRRRGRIAVGPAAVRYADPFGLSTGERLSTSRTLLVLPRVEAIRRGDLERILAHRAARSRAHDDNAIDGLGPYRPGAPASRIHWLAVARTGTLMERRAPEQAAAAAVTVVLDTSAPAGDRQLDMAVRAAASLCLGLARLGSCSLLLPGHHHALALGAELSRWEHLHAELALVEAGRAPHWRAAAGARRVVLVHARKPVARAEAERGVAFTVSPLPLAPGPILFTVAGCGVQTGGRLDSARAA